MASPLFPLFLLVALSAADVWESRYSPQNIVPWSVCITTYFLCIPTSYALWFVMRRENKRRDAVVGADGLHKAHEVNIKVFGDDGRNAGESGEQSHKLDTAFLDLTDRQNLNFRYPL